MRTNLLWYRIWCFVLRYWSCWSHRACRNTRFGVTYLWINGTSLKIRKR